MEEKNFRNKYDISSAEEGLGILIEHIKKHGPKKGYIVDIKYCLTKCDSQIQSMGIRTYHIEGNYKEVVFKLSQWIDDKREIYSLEEDERVPCFFMEIRHGILVKNKKNYYNYNVLTTRKGVYMLTETKTVFHSVAIYIKGEKYSTSRLYKYPPRVFIKNKLPIEEQIRLAQDFLSTDKNYSHMKIKVCYLEEEMLDVGDDEVPVLIYNKCIWGMFKSNVSITNDDQRPILSIEKQNIYESLIITYDFEFGWKKTIDKSFSKTKKIAISKPPSLITCRVKSLKHNITEDKIFKNLHEFLDYLSVIREDYKYKRDNLYCIAHNGMLVKTL